MQVTIRHADRKDAVAIAEIYNHGIEDGDATFDAFPVSSDRYSSYFESNARGSMLVAVAEGRVVGWTSVSPISGRWAYRYTCLGSTFVHRDFRGTRVGKALKAAQIEEAARLGYHSLTGEILSTNAVSLSLHLSFGFRVVGESWEAGYRNGKWIGLIKVEKILEDYHMRERQIRFSVVTDDLEKSISLYRDALGLRMRPICNAIAMFPLGAAEFEVCQREATKELLDFEFPGQRANGLLISLSLDTEQQLQGMLEAAVNCGATRIDDREPASKTHLLRDFNGVTWSITVASPATQQV